MQNPAQIPVWDIGVRLFHWSLVGCFIAAYITGEVETPWHEILGYVILGLISFRLLWGFIGTPYARFRQFIYTPKTVWAYLQSLRTRPQHYLGHNPASGWMVLLLLTLLFVISFTGIQLEAVEKHDHQAQIYLISIAYADDDRNEYEAREKGEYSEQHQGGDEAAEEFWEELHEAAVNLTILLIFIHILGVIVASRLHDENLVKAMITGKKEAKN